MYWDVFCRNGIIKTQYFGNDDGDAPKVEEIEAEYKGEGDRSLLNVFIKEWIGGIANTYGVNIPQDPVTEGKFGSVGSKLMTLGNGSDDDGNNNDDDKNQMSNSGAITSSYYFMPLLYTLICIVLVWTIN